MVTLRPIGALKAYIQDRSEVQVRSGISVREALSTVGIPPELVALVLVNDRAADKDYRLNDGDAVKLIAVIGGG